MKYYMLICNQLDSFDNHKQSRHVFNNALFELDFTPCKAEQPLQDMELQGKEEE